MGFAAMQQIRIAPPDFFGNFREFGGTGAHLGKFGGQSGKLRGIQWGFVWHLIFGVVSGDLRSQTPLHNSQGPSSRFKKSLKCLTLTFSLARTRAPEKEDFLF